MPRILPLWASLVALLSFSSCNKKHENGTATSTNVDQATPRAQPVTLNASGSTFQLPFQQAAIQAFERLHPDIKINYEGGGSGRGRQQLADNVVDFAGTDAPYHSEDLAKVKGGKILYFPLLLGPITISYDIPGVTSLRLSPVTIAKIFDRQITKWNSPEIATDNPGIKLPDMSIAVARRADGSGTTENFTKYLEIAAPGTWKLKSGPTVEWPHDTMAGPGNGGVAQIITSTRGAIGYVDLSDAKAARLKFAAVKNRNGKYIEPTPQAASAAGNGIELHGNLIFSAIDTNGESVYPITYQTWLIAYAARADKTKDQALKTYIRYLLTDGQKLLPGLDYAPLPKSLQQKALDQLDQMQITMLEGAPK